MKFLAVLAALLLASCGGEPAFAATLPLVPFPIAAALQSPLRTGATDNASYTNEATGMAAIGINVLIGVGNRPMFTSFGVDHGELAALKSAGISLIAGDNIVDPTGNTSLTSVASFLALDASLGGPTAISGWDLSDEPDCRTSKTGLNLTELIPGQVAAIRSYDPGKRPVLVNQTAWAKATEFLNYNADNPSGVATTTPCYTSIVKELQSSDFAGFDTYPWVSQYVQKVVGKYVAYGDFKTHSTDTLWITATTAQATYSLAHPGQIRARFVEVGSDEHPSGSSYTCANNICLPYGNEWRATPAQVGAEVWQAITTGAQMIDYFTFDTVGQGFGYGGTSSRATPADKIAATAAAANLTYIDAQIQTFANILAVPTSGLCQMDTVFAGAVKGGGVETLKQSCTAGPLTMTTSLPSFPGIARVQQYQGKTYLFVQGDRCSQTWCKGAGWDNSQGGVFSMRLMAGITAPTGGCNCITPSTGIPFGAGVQAHVIYDSNDRYDPAHSATGMVFPLSSTGSFSDTFGAHNDDYQFKVYAVY